MTEPVTLSYTNMLADLSDALSAELGLTAEQLQAIATQFDQGATPIYLTRYRPDLLPAHVAPHQLRRLLERLNERADLLNRRERIIENIRRQGKLTEELLQTISQLQDRVTLEDYYLPYRPKRKSPSQQAIDAGLEPFADRLLQETVEPDALLAVSNEQGETSAFWHESYPDTASQLSGIESILLQRWLRQPELLAAVRERFGQQVFVRSRLAHENKPKQAARYREFHDWREALNQVRTGQMLALLTGQREGLLTVELEGDDIGVIELLQNQLQLNEIEPAARREFLTQAVSRLWQQHIRPHVEKTLLAEPQQAADRQALRLVTEQAQQRLMVGAAGARVVMGIHPSARMGSRVAVVGPQGDVLANTVIYPLPPREEREAAITELADLCRTHHVELIAVGNAPACRDILQLVADMQRQHSDLTVNRLLVNEQGGNTYAGSEAAAVDLPDLEPPSRVAIWLARQVQDPLAELARLETRALLGDLPLPEVAPNVLDRTVADVFRELISRIGVDVNTAPAALLAYVPGLDRNIAQQLVSYRTEQGPFASREALKEVPRFGERTFEQAAPFLTLDGEQPLDRTLIHPQHYALVGQFAQALGLSTAELLAQSERLNDLSPDTIASFGQPDSVVRNVMRQLQDGIRDPRPAFKVAQFRTDVTDASALQAGDLIEGIVINTMPFGAFIDIGLPQDGLVHISELSDQFVNDVNQFVKPGQIVQARVLKLDAENNRLALSLKGLLPAPQRTTRDSTQQPDSRPGPRNPLPPRPEGQRRPDARGQTATPEGERPSRQREPRRDGRPQDQRPSRPRSDRADRPEGTRPPRHDNRPARTKAAEEIRATKVGSLGALLQQAGLKRSKD